MADDKAPNAPTAATDAELLAREFEKASQRQADLERANDELLKRLESLERRPAPVAGDAAAGLSSVTDPRKALEAKRAAARVPDDVFTIAKQKLRFAVPGVYIDGRKVSARELLNDRSRLAELIEEYPNIVRPA